MLVEDRFVVKKEVYPYLVRTLVYIEIMRQGMTEEVLFYIKDLQTKLSKAVQATAAITKREWLGRSSNHWRLSSYM